MGHYPDWNTRFIVDQLKANPYWKINLEIEPETWDRAALVDPKALQELKEYIANQSAGSRIEYVNPAYAQSYNFNINGESIIRQFEYGIKKLKTQFPAINFTTYSSEEPCFTSMLPQILKGFGFKYASLKNPNTCFGGYTRAHANELVSWTSADGSSLMTSPRYAIEDLSTKSTWQTIAWNNSKTYINKAFKSGIKNPIGMTLQDAGWTNGPFLGNAKTYHNRNIYTTWRNYFEHVADKRNAPVWNLTQEDILVSLVWGSQVTQRIAQQVRVAENKLLQAEKIDALIKLHENKLADNNQHVLDSAWRTLLLSQHHDCWIVPYNGDKDDTWADKVAHWTANTLKLSSNVVENDLKPHLSARSNTITVFNTQGSQRTATVEFKVKNATNQALTVYAANGNALATQHNIDKETNEGRLVFNAALPAFGFTTFVVKNKGSNSAGASVMQLTNGEYQLETDLYKLKVDPAKGGTISSLITTKDGFEYISNQSAHHFNALRGNFSGAGGVKSSALNKAVIDVLENGPVRIKIAIKGKINDTDFTQTISLTQGQPLIDLSVNINWTRNQPIGENLNKRVSKWTDYHKGFYNDSSKLVITFPTSFQQKAVYKNAPFDVLKSKLEDTFFSTWDSIKNNVVLDWLDVTDAGAKHALAMFTDHTTSYTHGKNYPLGLVAQYSGMGLWGRNYVLDGATQIHYALLPHTGDWKQAVIWQSYVNWAQPADVYAGAFKGGSSASLIETGKNLVLTTAQPSNGRLKMRVFNASPEAGIKTIKLNTPVKNITIVDFTGKVLSKPTVKRLGKNTTLLPIAMPAFGVKNILVQL